MCLDPNIYVLDRGYVRLIDKMGTDLTVVNSARVSFAKESKELNESDKKLIQFLIDRNEMSPFRHAFVTFEIKAPLMVARQMYKSVTGADHTFDSWNETSRRYVTVEPEFYIPQPSEWRSAPENRKQGSGHAIEDQGLQTMLTEEMQQNVIDCVRRYNAAINMGVAVEQARGFLPAYFMYTMWRWSASLQSVLFFLSQRLEDKAQFEIRIYAQAIAEIVQPLFPISYKAFMKL